MKLNIIEYDAEKLIDRLIAIKREPTKTYLSEVKNDITQADLQYNDFACRNLLKTIIPIILNENQKNALIRCYKYKTSLTDLIIKEIRKENEFHTRYCPFCGYYDPLEIDHYLPMKDFPEFSFIPINLIPICPKCNKTKNKYWIENDERLYLNKYFDDDNQDEFLICKPNIIDENNIIFEYCLDNEKLNEISIGNIIKTHYEKLNIMKIYKSNSNTILSELDETLLLFNGNFQDLKDSIEKHYENCRDNYGINFYKTVTYKSIFETTDVLTWYYNRIPEENKNLE